VQYAIRWTRRSSPADWNAARFGDSESGRHLRDAGGEHLQPVHRTAQRGIPVVEEPRTLVVEVPVISGVVDPRSAGEKSNDWT